MKAFILTISIIILSIFLYLSYFGLFSSVKITESDTGPFTLIYEKYEGDYRQTAEIMDRIYSSLLDEYGIQSSMSFGIFYDNPRKVDAVKLRSISGCILFTRDSLLIKNLQRNYHIGEFPLSPCVIAEFPYKGSMSIFIGVLKVYPLLNEYLEKKGVNTLPVMEIYDRLNHKILYLAAVNPQQQELESLLY